MHSFQLKLLKQEINHPERGVKVFTKELDTDMSIFRKMVRSELMPTVVSRIRREIRNDLAMVQSRLNGKLDKLSERQEKLLQNGSHCSVVIMDGRSLPKFLVDVLAFRPKHPVRDKFNKVDMFVC